MNGTVQQYINYYDFCDPIPYKEMLLKPFTVAQIRDCQFSMYCLSVDPYEFDDLTLLPLKRLDFIFAILTRKQTGSIPDAIKWAEKYELVCASFGKLLHTLFSDYNVYPGDPANPKRKKAITFSKKESAQDFTVLSVDEFEEMSELILYQNAVDTSYQRVPLGLRKEIQRKKQAKAKGRKTQEINIEHLIDIVAWEFKDQTYEKTKNMPVRKFLNQIDNIRNKQEYEILTHPMYNAKNLKHWMYGEYDRDGYSDYIQREDEAAKELEQIK